jgi:DNA polymerase-3 subunit epsilon
MPERPSRQFIALDLETTGLLADSDRVVEFGAVRFDAEGREIERFEQLVNPGRSMPRAAQAVHGISDDDLIFAPPARDVLPRFLEFLGAHDETTLLAHNAAFDAGFLGRELARLGRKPPGHSVVDTLALARKRLPQLSNHRLDTLARVLDLDPEGPHRALADSLRVKGLFLSLGGPELPAEALLAYPIHDVKRPFLAPVGWDLVAEAIERGWKVRLVYLGGTRGEAPRDVTPRQFVSRGGVPYLVAFCHLDAFEKSFRLDRVRHFEVVP